MLKTYQFKTHCKGDSHSSKTVGYIGAYYFARTHDKRKANAFRCTSETVFKFNCIMSVETTPLTKLEYYISLVHVRQPRMTPVSQTLTSDQLSVAKLLVTSAKVDNSYVFTSSLCLCLSVGRITEKSCGPIFSEISGGVRCMQARYTSRRPINGVNALKWNAWLLIFVLEYCFEQLAHVGPPGEWLKSRRYSNNLRLYFSVSSGTLNSTIPYYTFQ